MSFTRKYFSEIRSISPYFNFIKRNLNTAENVKEYTPRRCIMYVPGNDDRKVQKIPLLKADCVVLDCEDGVALNRKEEARHKIRKLLDESSIDFVKSECSVRINSLDTEFWEKDIEVVLGGKNLPQAIHLPKVESPMQLDILAEKIDRVLGNRESRSQLNLIIFSESANSLLDLKSICQHGLKLANQSAPFQLDAVVFGSDDFCADIGATRTPEAKELQFARQYLVTVAKSMKLQAIDLVYIDYNDLDGLRLQSLEGAQMGFTGKQVIHPSQVSVVQSAFTPSEEKTTWARELIAAFEEHQKSGKGAFTFRGHMIDRPLLLQAKHIMRLAEYVH